MPALPQPKDFHATVRWQRGEALFTDGRYPRSHVWVFDEGVEIPASAAPACMPQPADSRSTQAHTSARASRAGA